MRRVPASAVWKPYESTPDTAAGPNGLGGSTSVTPPSLLITTPPGGIHRMKKYLVLAAGALGTLVAVSAAVGTLMAIAAVDAANAATAGRTVSHHGTRYTITKVRTARSIGDGFLGGHAKGVYVIVNVTLTDLKHDPATIMASNLNLTTHGRSYDV